MIAKRAAIATLILGFVTTAYAQSRRDFTTLAQPEAQAPAETPPASSGQMNWRPPTGSRRPAREANETGTLAPVRTASASNEPRRPIARVTEGPSNLPNDAGQRWLDYDISPYTTRVTSTNRPEQAILDWVLRETGYEAWHGDVISVLNADHRTLHVYHTPEIQKQVSDMVDRFVNTEAESHVFGMRVITVGKPDWRTTANRMLRSIKTQSPGIQAWLMAKEDAAQLVAELRRRNDFQEHSTPHLLLNNGQSKVISTLRTRNYARDITLRPDAWPGYEPQLGQINEGFNFEISPLLSIDGRDVDAVSKCEVDQVEKMLQVKIPVPTAADRRNQATVEVPQIISSRLHERFRWPAEMVLLISLGVGPTPVPQAPNTLPVKVPLITPGTRADLLVMVESKGKLSGQSSTLQPGQREAGTYHGRY